MKFAEFESLVRRLVQDIPPEFQGGVVDVTVSPETLPHPVRADVYTLGECVPLEWTSGSDLQSRVILYHGSFRALARLGDFDWRVEAWETLTHELRHHLEWKADLAGLEAYDWAAEQNFARHEGDAFDPVFYRNGESIAPGVFKVEDDVFLEREGGGGRGEEVEVPWHGRRYRVSVPAAPRRAWVFVTLEGLEESPPGDAVLVVPGRLSAFDLFGRAGGAVCATARVEPPPG